MARQNNQSSIRDIIGNIKNGNASPVYLLVGEEAYYIDLIVDALEKYLLDEADKDFNLSVFYGSDADLEYVVGAAQQFPVMATKKLVILKEAQTMAQAKSQLDKLAPYIQNPSLSTVFAVAFKAEPPVASSAFMKAAKSDYVTLFKSSVPRDYELPPLVRDYCAARKISIDKEAVEMLCEYIGSPLSKLFGELNKLISIVQRSGNRITAEQVAANIGVSKEHSNFELVDALCRKDYPKAIKIVNYFQDNSKNNPTVVTTASIFNFFTNLVTAHYLPDKSEAAIMQAFGFKAQIQVRNLQLAMRNYTPMQSVNAIHYIRDFDRKSKGVESLQNEYSLLREMIFKIFT